jgi:hypothetical protein
MLKIEKLPEDGTINQIGYNHLVQKDKPSALRV